MKRKFLMVIWILISSISVALAKPTLFFKDIKEPHQTRAISDIPNTILQIINTRVAQDPHLLKIVTYHFNHYYLLYFLSNESWKITTERVNVDTNNVVLNQISPYQETVAELKQLDPAQSSQCPDPSVEFVAISAYPDVGDVTQALNLVYEAARKKYKTVEILGDNADGQMYENWLACPNLKGFYSIGHGDSDKVMVANGDFVTFNYFMMNEALRDIYLHTTVVLNSCEVFNYPFGSELIFGNRLRRSDKFRHYPGGPGTEPLEFVGGYTDLLIGSSEDISACFLKKALNGEKMDDNLVQRCVGIYDFYYKDFGLSSQGKYLGSL